MNDDDTYTNLAFKIEFEALPVTARAYLARD